MVLTRENFANNTKILFHGNNTSSLETLEAVPRNPGGRQQMHPHVQTKFLGDLYYQAARGAKNVYCRSGLTIL